MKSSTLKSFLVLYLVGVVSIYALVFWKSAKLVQKGYPDFAIYYCAGTVVRQGLGHHLYDDTMQFKVEQQFASDVPLFRGPLPYTHPPFEALFFVPFSYFPYPEAYVLWDLLNVMLLAAIPFLLRPHLPHLEGYSPLLWILASLAFFPIFFTLLQGQDAILLLFLYTLAFVCLKKNQCASAGAWIALGLFKFHLILPFLFLLLVQKRKRVLYGFVPVAIALALLSVALAGTKAIMAYPRFVLHLEDTMAGSEMVPAGMPSLRGLMYIFFPAGAYVAPVLLLSIGLLLFTGWKCRGVVNADLFDLKFSLALVCTALVGYHVVSYDLSMLMLPVFVLTNYLLAENRFRQWPGVLVVFGITVLFFPPLQLFLSMRYKRFALMGCVLVLWVYAIARELSLRTGSEVALEGASLSA